MALKIIALKNPKSLGEILLRGEPIDRNIVELVKVLNYMGITTFSSCEGHIDGHVAEARNRYPWVTMMFVNGDGAGLMKKLDRMVSMYNEKSALKWWVAEMPSPVPGLIYELLPNCEAENETTLRAMQQNAHEPAEFLFLSERSKRTLGMPRGYA